MLNTDFTANNPIKMYIILLNNLVKYFKIVITVYKYYIIYISVPQKSTNSSPFLKIFS